MQPPTIGYLNDRMDMCSYCTPIGVPLGVPLGKLGKKLRLSLATAIDVLSITTPDGGCTRITKVAAAKVNVFPILLQSVVLSNTHLLHWSRGHGIERSLLFSSWHSQLVTSELPPTFNLVAQYGGMGTTNVLKSRRWLTMVVKGTESKRRLPDTL